MDLHQGKGSSKREQGFQALLDSVQNIQCVDNPQKLVNYQRCMALVKELEDELERPIQIAALPGGSIITLRLFWAPYFSSFNTLLGELIGRCCEFSPSPDPSDPCYIFLSMTVFYQDRIANGRLLRV